MNDTIEAIKNTRFVNRQLDVFTSGIPKCTIEFDWNGTKNYADDDIIKSVNAVLKKFRAIGFWRSSASQHAFGTEYRASLLTAEKLEKVKKLAIELTELLAKHQEDNLEYINKAAYIKGVEIDGLFVERT